eukprot:scaffold31279_cov65-Cyclotella_meneghiniana.AAC.3
MDMTTPSFKTKKRITQLEKTILATLGIQLGRKKNDRRWKEYKSCLVEYTSESEESKEGEDNSESEEDEDNLEEKTEDDHDGGLVYESDNEGNEDEEDCESNF